jgi:ABC-type multidrug transport system fused ATPase/permease subunit
VAARGNWGLAPCQEFGKCIRLEHSLAHSAAFGNMTTADDMPLYCCAAQKTLLVSHSHLLCACGGNDVWTVTLWRENWWLGLEDVNFFLLLVLFIVVLFISTLSLSSFVIFIIIIIIIIIITTRSINAFSHKLKHLLQRYFFYTYM